VEDPDCCEWQFLSLGLGVWEELDAGTRVMYSVWLMIPDMSQTHLDSRGVRPCTEIHEASFRRRTSMNEPITCASASLPPFHFACHRRAMLLYSSSCLEHVTLINSSFFCLIICFFPRRVASRYRVDGFLGLLNYPLQSGWRCVLVFFRKSIPVRGL